MYCDKCWSYCLIVGFNVMLMRRSSFFANFAFGQILLLHVLVLVAFLFCTVEILEWLLEK